MSAAPLATFTVVFLLAAAFVHRNDAPDEPRKVLVRAAVTLTVVFAVQFVFGYLVEHVRIGWNQ